MCLLLMNVELLQMLPKFAIFGGISCCQSVKIIVIVCSLADSPFWLVERSASRREVNLLEDFVSICTGASAQNLKGRFTEWDSIQVATAFAGKRLG